MMSYDVDKALEAYTNIRMMLKGLPRDIWPVFLPETVEGLPQMELNIVDFIRRAHQREQVIAIQRLCDMPLRPNEELPSVKAKARLKGKNIDQMLRRRSGGNKS